MDSNTPPLQNSNSQPEKSANNTKTGHSSNSNGQTVSTAGTVQNKSANAGNIAMSQSKVTSSLDKINREAKEKETQEKAAIMGMNYIDIASVQINPDLLKIISKQEAEQALLIPFYRLGKKLRVSVAHPTNPQTRELINKLKQKEYLINTNLSSDIGIKQALKLYDSDQYKVKKEIDTDLDEAKIKTYEKELEDLSNLGEKLKNLNSEEALYQISQGALKAGSSDIHLETEEEMVRVRFRVDGLLHQVTTIDKETFKNIANQAKYQAKLKMNVNDIPQDGRYKFTVNNRNIDVRVSVLPTEFGESFVLRLLDSNRSVSSFEELGYSGKYLKKIEKLSKISHGMILMTGPTGSGKTTSLYTLLSKFNKPESKVITLEDPIEYHLKGISQSQIKEKDGYTFASGLKSVLRQDPEVVMIGEIRDQATAEVAAQAALTGHVMLSTLHTNSAIETIPRLINIGLPAFMIAPSLHTIIAQRLVRRLCEDCKRMEPVPNSTKQELETFIKTMKTVRPEENLTIPQQLPVPVGCDKCSHSGYKGRICIVEMLEINYEIKELILEGASSSKLIQAARKTGMITLKEDGLHKVLEGITTIQEVHRATAINN